MIKPTCNALMQVASYIVVCMQHACSIITAMEMAPCSQGREEKAYKTDGFLLGSLFFSI
jgi:hypothetical protein